MNNLITNNILSTLNIFLKRKKYKEIFDLTDKILFNDESYYPSRIYTFRALSEMGKFTEAANIINGHLNEIPITHRCYNNYRLWSTFINLFITESIEFEQTLATLEVIQKDAPDIAVKALARYLQSRVISFAMAVGSMPQNKRSVAIALMNQAAKFYSDCGDNIEYAGSIKAVALLWLSYPNPDYEHAQSILESLLLFRNHPDDSYFQGAVLLILSGLSFKQMHRHGNTIDLVLTDSLYNKVMVHFESAGYELGEADVNYEYGALLLEYGYPVGIKLLRQAIFLYEKSNEIINRQTSWKKIADWYLRHGLNDESKAAEKESNVLNANMQLGMTATVEAVMEVHAAFVQEREGKAVELAKDYLAKYGQTRMAPQIMTLLANALSQGKNIAPALVYFREIINYYQRSEPSNFLSEAYFNYGNVIFSTDIIGGKNAMQKAIDISKQLKDDINTAKYYRGFAVNLCLYSLTHPDSGNNDAIKEYFAGAIKLLEDSKTCLEVIERVHTYEQIGNYHFQSGGLDEAMESFSKAEELCIIHKLQLNHAFLLTYMGLVLLQLARNQSNEQVFSLAAVRFSYAAYLFKNMNAFRYSWNSKFHQAQTISELAQVESNPEKKENYFIDADNEFIEAANIVDYLKGLQFSQINKEAEKIYGANRELSMDFNKVFNLAFNLNFILRKNYALSFSWAERNKSRQLQTKLWDLYKNAMFPGFNTINTFQDLRTLLFHYESNFNRKRITLAEYYFNNEQIILFLIQSGWDAPETYTIPIDKSKLFIIVERLFFRGAESLLDKLRDGLESEWTDCSCLIEPILRVTEPGDLIYVIPHKFLHQVPFHALKGGDGKYFIERNPIVYSPSASILFQLEKNRNTLTEYSTIYEKSAIFGNSKGDLPKSQDEAMAINELVKGNVFIRDEVTKERLVTALESSTLLHFAGHSISSPNDGLRQHIVLARGDTFTALELMNISSTLNLLVLSGCETGTSEVQADIDELVGLPSAALYGGTASVLTSLWKVHDASTKQFFLYFYEALINESLPKAFALQRAMKKMIAEGKYSFFHWAPFTLIGKWY